MLTPKKKISPKTFLYFVKKTFSTLKKNVSYFREKFLTLISKNQIFQMKIISYNYR